MVFYRKSLHMRRMEILGDPNTKNTKSPQRKFRFQNQDSGICFISSGNVLRVGTNLSERFFLLLKCRKYPKKLFFFLPKPRFRMVFHGFPCQNFIHCSRHAYRSLISDFVENQIPNRPGGWYSFIACRSTFPRGL